jgi:hypothetical protein
MACFEHDGFAGGGIPGMNAPTTIGRYERGEPYSRIGTDSTKWDGPTRTATSNVFRPEGT